jgi:hypothetical protein
MSASGREPLPSSLRIGGGVESNARSSEHASDFRRFAARRNATGFARRHSGATAGPVSRAAPLYSQKRVTAIPASAPIMYA